MSNKRKSINFFQFLILVTVMVLSAIALPFSYGTEALAADNYNAPMDGYQETRNPNRVNATEEDLKNTDVYKTNEKTEDSIYQKLEKKVDSERNSALKNQDRKASLAD